MAYGESSSFSWARIDLTTHAGAQSATHAGGIASFMFAGREVLGILFFGGLAGYNTLEGTITLIYGALAAIVAIIAGLRLRSGKGAFWGIGVIALGVLELIVAIANFSIGGMIITGILLVVLVNGVRGALALKKVSVSMMMP